MRIFVFASILLFCVGTVRADYKIKQCDPAAQAEIDSAYGRITGFLDGVLSRTSGFLNAAQRDEYRRKWASLKIKCSDDHGSCDNEADIGGYAHGGLGNAANVCYYNLVYQKQRVCDLVEVIVHEAGHADGFPKGQYHNDPKEHPAARKDTVYRLGYAGRDECLARLSPTENRILPGSVVPTVGVGGACKVATECISGKCRCGACYERSKVSGLLCRHNDECASGKCTVAIDCVGYGSCK